VSAAAVLASPALPGTPGPRLQAVYEALEPAERAALHNHLVGGTSAEWLASTLQRRGHQIGATAIKTWRRSLNG
jgi:hypothetical protein